MPLLTNFWRDFVEKHRPNSSTKYFMTGRRISKLTSRLDGWCILAMRFPHSSSDARDRTCFLSGSVHSWSEGSLFSEAIFSILLSSLSLLPLQKLPRILSTGRDSVGNWESGSQTFLADLEKGVRWRTPDHGYCEERRWESECTRESAEKERRFHRERDEGRDVVTAIWSLSWGAKGAVVFIECIVFPPHPLFCDLPASPPFYSLPPWPEPFSEYLHLAITWLCIITVCIPVSILCLMWLEIMKR